ncbi:hypothetical protein PSTG_16927, partial [Puccinia striiformis f. sp. tritici PST-78]
MCMPTLAGHFHVEIAEDPRGFHMGAPCKGGRMTRVGLATRTPRGHHPWSPHGIMGGVRVDTAGANVNQNGGVWSTFGAKHHPTSLDVTQTFAGERQAFAGSVKGLQRPAHLQRH